MSDEIQEIDDEITVPELNTITTIQADDAIMLTHANGVTEKIAAQNITNRDTFIIAATPTLTGPTLGTGFAIRILFTAALTGLNASSPLVINYNGTDYTVKVAKDGALVNFVAKEFTENNTTVYKYLQAYTVLELIYNGTNLVIVGNPLVHSSADYKMYADGSEELSVVDEVAADNLHSVTSNAVADIIKKIKSFFSTEEDTGGKWIDGKPIYRKVFTVTNTSSAQITIGNIPSYDWIVNIRVVGRISTNNDIITDGYGNNNLGVFVRGNGDIIVVNNYDLVKVIATVEYTKTID